MIPHERSLVKKFEKRPFTIVGVNSDPKDDYAKGLESKNKDGEELRVLWNSFYDGGSTQGPIAMAWNVQGWPTLYFIDVKGVIRHKSVGDDGKGEALLEELIAEAEKEPAGPAPTK